MLTSLKQISCTRVVFRMNRRFSRLYRGASAGSRVPSESAKNVSDAKSRTPVRS